MKKKIEKEVAANIEQCVVPETFQYLLENHYYDLMEATSIYDVKNLFKAETVLKVMKLSPYKVPTIHMGKEIVILAAGLLKSKM